MPLTLKINGQPQLFDRLAPGSNINALLEVLGLKSDRVALELNGVITPRATWDTQSLAESDEIELVHFVGGG